jgi:hypothetical protein
MQAVVRRYSGQDDKKLVDLLEKHRTEIERLIRPTDGFVRYSLVRTADGGFSVSVYDERADIDSRILFARDWVAKNADTAGSGVPPISEGAAVLQVTRTLSN